MGDASVPKKSSRPSLFLTRTFLGRNRPSNEDAARFPRPGDRVEFDECGGDLKLSNGTEGTLRGLVDISVGGIIVFTYPRAHTPGCTKQACLFRDAYQDLTSMGFAIYGLSRDSVAQNASFSLHNHLPFPLICDSKGMLITALGLNKSHSETMRGVIVMDKAGKVLASMAGNPSATLESVAPLVQTLNAVDQSPPLLQEDNSPSRVYGAHEPCAHQTKQPRRTSDGDAGKPSQISPALERAQSSTKDQFLRVRSSSEGPRVVSIERCNLCTREHGADESCSTEVDMIQDTVARLRHSGLIGEACQLELANKIAHVAGELAVIAASIDAHWSWDEYNERMKSATAGWEEAG